jgi:transposase
LLRDDAFRTASRQLASAQATILAQREALALSQTEIKVGRLEIERLKLMLAKVRREQFARTSERGKQLELAIDDLEETQATGGEDPDRRA